MGESWPRTWSTDRTQWGLYFTTEVKILPYRPTKLGFLDVYYMAKFALPLSHFFSRHACCRFHLVYLEGSSQYFCVLGYNFFTANYNRSRCRSRWENLDRGQYRFQPIKFVHSVVSSPCGTRPYNNDKYNDKQTAILRSFVTSIFIVSALPRAKTITLLQSVP